MALKQTSKKRRKKMERPVKLIIELSYRGKEGITAPLLAEHAQRLSEYISDLEKEPEEVRYPPPDAPEWITMIKYSDAYHPPREIYIFLCKKCGISTRHIPRCSHLEGYPQYVEEPCRKYGPAPNIPLTPGEEEKEEARETPEVYGK